MTAFANGTEFEIWSSKWCEHCAHDHAAHVDEFGGCDLVLQSLIGEHPVEWVPPHDSTPTKYVCQRFTACTDCGGDPIETLRSGLLAGATP